MTALLIKRLVWGDGEQKDVLETIDSEDVNTGVEDKNEGDDNNKYNTETEEENDNDNANNIKYDAETEEENDNDGKESDRE
ncbi:MAG: hypothetical protein ACOVRN_17630, partial [Flavobacterium sp.]